MGILKCWCYIAIALIIYILSSLRCCIQRIISNDIFGQRSVIRSTIIVICNWYILRSNSNMIIFVMEIHTISQYVFWIFSLFTKWKKLFSRMVSFLQNYFFVNHCVVIWRKVLSCQLFVLLFDPQNLCRRRFNKISMLFHNFQVLFHLHILSKTI